MDDGPRDPLAFPNLRDNGEVGRSIPYWEELLRRRFRSEPNYQDLYQEAWSLLLAQGRGDPSTGVLSVLSMKTTQEIRLAFEIALHGDVDRANWLVFAEKNEAKREFVRQLAKTSQVTVKIMAPYDPARGPVGMYLGFTMMTLRRHGGREVPTSDAGLEEEVTSDGLLFLRDWTRVRQLLQAELWGLRGTKPEAKRWVFMLAHGIRIEPPSGIDPTAIDRVIREEAVPYEGETMKLVAIERMIRPFLGWAKLPDEGLHARQAWDKIKSISSKVLRQLEEP